MRLFYASFLSEKNRAACESLVARVSSDVPRSLRPVPRGSHHLTHAFLGEVAEGEVEGLVALLEELREIPAFAFRLAAPTILMGRGSPRLVKVDLQEGGEQVVRLQERLRAGLLERDPSLAGRPKPPHVTIARFPRGARRGLARRVEESMARQREALRFEDDRLSRVDLVKSTLAPSGPVYESVGEVRLAG
jgi:2'-5' RNA ligase